MPAAIYSFRWVWFGKNSSLIVLWHFITTMKTVVVDYCIAVAIVFIVACFLFLWYCSVAFYSFFTAIWQTNFPVAINKVSIYPSISSFFPFIHRCLSAQAGLQHSTQSPVSVWGENHGDAGWRSVLPRPPRKVWLFGPGSVQQSSL